MKEAEAWRRRWCLGMVVVPLIGCSITVMTAPAGKKHINASSDLGRALLCCRQLVIPAALCMEQDLKAACCSCVCCLGFGT